MQSHECHISLDCCTKPYRRSTVVDDSLLGFAPYWNYLSITFLFEIAIRQLVQYANWVKLRRIYKVSGIIHWISVYSALLGMSSKITVRNFAAYDIQKYCFEFEHLILRKTGFFSLRLLYSSRSIICQALLFYHSQSSIVSAVLLALIFRRQLYWLL